MKGLFIFFIFIACVWLSKSLSIGIPGSSRGLLSQTKVNLLQTSSILIRGGKKKNKKPVDEVDADQNEPVPVEEGELRIDDDEEESSASKTIAKYISNLYPKALMKTPPITQFYIGSSIVITSLAYVLNNNKWPALLSFSWKDIFLKLQVWRLFTAFLSLGPFDLFYPFNLMYVWQHMSQLEKLSCKKPEEFFMLLMFGAGSLVTIYSFLGLPLNMLGHYLASYLVYIWSRAYEGQDVNFMDLITLKAEMVPWFFCLQTMIMERDIPLADLIGIAVGHVYFYLNEKKLIPTPLFVTQLFGRGILKKRYEEIRQEFV